jgi:hypothetical protein
MKTTCFLWTTAFVLVVIRLQFIQGLIPATPQEQTRRAIASIKKSIEATKAKPDDGGFENGAGSGAGAGVGRRLFVDYLIPLPLETKAEDIDPWPGGLAQMYPYAEEILSDILKGVVDVPNGKCSSQILDAADCCGFFIQESQTASRNDVAAVLFPGVDQLDKLLQIDEMVGPERTLLLFNRQFQRPVDFGTFNKGRAQKEIFDRFTYGFAFQEFACRGEDTKLVYEFPTGWQSCVICEEDNGNREIKLLEDQMSRPSYEQLEKKINEVLPQPLWMRKMGEVEEKGFKFQR